MELGALFSTFCFPQAAERTPRRVELRVLVDLGPLATVLSLASAAGNAMADGSDAPGVI